MGVDAVYLLTPTSQNVDRIIMDFQGRRTYKSAHIFFIDGQSFKLSCDEGLIHGMIGIDDDLAQKLTQGMPPDILRSFVELYCNFWGELGTRKLSVRFSLLMLEIFPALEDRVFSVKTPSSFFTMFGNPGGAASNDLAMEAFEDDLRYTGRHVSEAAMPRFSSTY